MGLLGIGVDLSSFNPAVINDDTRADGIFLILALDDLIEDAMS